MNLLLAPPRSTPVNTALARRDLAERRRLVIGLMLSALAMAWMVAALYSSVGPAYDDALQGLPDAIRSMLGDADFSTPEGFLHVELFTFVAPGLVIGAAISLAAGSLAGAEQSGRLALVTTSPLKRSSVVTAATIATLLAVLVVTAGLMVGIMVGSATGDLGVSSGRVTAACCSVGLLALATGMITLAAGAITGRRGLAVGVGTGVAVASYAIDAFFPLNATLEPFAKVSLWYPYDANQPLVNGLDATHVAILLAVAVVGAAVAHVAFERRDINC